MIILTHYTHVNCIYYDKLFLRLYKKVWFVGPDVVSLEETLPT